MGLITCSYWNKWETKDKCAREWQAAKKNERESVECRVTIAAINEFKRNMRVALVSKVMCALYKRESELQWSIQLWTELYAL